MTCLMSPVPRVPRLQLCDDADGLSCRDAPAACTATNVATAANNTASTARLTMWYLPLVVVGTPQGTLAGHRPRMGDESVTRRLRDDYRPRGRAAPKNLPASDRQKPIRPYIASSVGSDARRAF